MNTIQPFWDEFCVATKQEHLNYREAFQFGASAD